ncbi:methyltransferase family protein [Natronobacterium texcoconense]|uniref:Protein-S-isoprenylcysteine O-methyltransferase Ste14 n=1 Tax=Natronobacterium texcoconense TaxID=1095778 RepID=A0A1H1C1E3_NATTX|nr:isoprenylcysteine carboxylmethyltransferase family protein [Natronobacterium texcoconense]SDQ57949.1 Protein-S-isoprenylcysteine O-methyltransferase Ste14 [Natronobacterium texcoconense]
MTSPIYSQPPNLYVFLAAVAVWVVSDLSIGFRYGNQSGSKQDRGSKHAIGAAVCGGVLSAALLPVWVPAAEMPYPAAAFWLGIGLLLLGVSVRQYAVRTLEDDFSLEVSVDETDTVVTSGPYQWVRHPSYTGGLVTLVGIGVAVGHWLSFGATVVAGVLGYRYRICVEERALRATLGDSYEEYASRTPYRLLPFVW